MDRGTLKARLDCTYANRATVPTALTLVSLLTKSAKEKRCAECFLWYIWVCRGLPMVHLCVQRASYGTSVCAVAKLWAVMSSVELASLS
jgi:hypothetical protein